MDSQGGEDSRQGGSRRTRWVRRWLVDWAVPHSCVEKPGGTTGEQDKPCNPGFQRGEIKPQTSGCKNLWELQLQEKLPASQESLLEKPTGS